MRVGGSCSSCSCPHGVDRDTTCAAGEAGCAEQAVSAGDSPDELLPRAFGHREGELPVCEDMAARCLALPFFPEMSEGQVERVAEVLREAIGRV